MIQANELRIGNWVQHPDNPNPHRVNVYGILNQSEKGLFRPIPLTEDWLLKFGFEINLYWRKDWLQIQQSENEFSIYISDDNSGYEFGEPFKYVHQLQNLFFALTGTELELKP